MWVRENPSSGYTEWAKQRLELGRQRKLKLVGQYGEEGAMQRKSSRNLEGAVLLKIKLCVHRVSKDGQ